MKLKLKVMKTLKSILLLLLTTGAVLAQPNPDNMFISGTVLDVNGQEIPNLEVCVYYSSNNPVLPSDTICVTTDNNGYYYVEIVNGSVTGPNVEFTVITYPPLCFAPIIETVNNGQGSINVATVNFVACANSAPCEADITSTIDSSGLFVTYTFQGSGTGVAPLAYSWDIDGVAYTGQTISYSPNTNNPFLVCLTVTDGSGCVATTCDTLNYNPGNNGCSVSITTTIDSTGGGLSYTLTASGGFSQYVWSSNQVGQSITVQNINPNGEVYCVSATDANGCTATACDTLFPINQSCNVTIIANAPPGGNINSLEAYANGVAPFSYLWNTGDITQSISATTFGTYCVEVTDATGCTTSECFTVGNNQCQAGFLYPGSPSGTMYVGDTLQLVFDGTISSSNSYLWTVSTLGFTWTSTETNPWFAIPPTLIPINGVSVEICVTVTNNATNCSDTYCETVLAVPANNANCAANYSWAPSNILGAPLPAIQFTDNSTNAGSWFWDFGDGSTSTDQNPLHAYNGSGNYIVCLTIVSADQSCQATYCDSVIVGGNSGNCNAGFSNSGPTPIGYTFSANVQSPNYSYVWEIDGVVVGNGYEAYAPGFANGVHTICLTISDGVCTDTQCITITVGSNNCYGYISGAVYAGSNNNPLDVGVVYLITFDPSTNQLTAVDSMVLDSGNYYFFGPLACGDYLVKAASYPASQYYSSHIPTYYGNSPFWGFAETVTLGQPNTQITADINLIAASNPGGPGFIGGDVTQGANKTDPGDPLGGMEVLLFNMSGQAIAYTYTNANGEFAFPYLAYGTYQVYVEAIGIQTIPAVVTIGPNNPEVDDVHILASESLISTGIEEFDFEGAIGEVYPNPVLNMANITLDIENGVEVEVSVMDLTGRRISSQFNTLSAGKSTVSVSFDELTEGYYFLNIQDVEGNFSVTRKFMRID